ncbi:hypothetical protein Pan241w_05550 [Gimesia alba]|uniref:Uncharacterized protein n=1 Tax=Gimesia alba TaxID=2527973 RepID=A0A517R9G0_9PLAN|nr:hypothetical protein Pan241w_05550 [Gimesia alba]
MALLACPTVFFSSLNNSNHNQYSTGVCHCWLVQQRRSDLCNQYSRHPIIDTVLMERPEIFLTVGQADSATPSSIRMTYRIIQTPSLTVFLSSLNNSNHNQYSTGMCHCWLVQQCRSDLCNQYSRHPIIDTVLMERPEIFLTVGQADSATPSSIRMTYRIIQTPSLTVFLSSLNNSNHNQYSTGVCHCWLVQQCRSDLCNQYSRHPIIDTVLMERPEIFLTVGQADSATPSPIRPTKNISDIRRTSHPV